MVRKTMRPPRRKASATGAVRRVPPGQDRAREVTLSANRQVGLASQFARAMAVKPQAKLLEVLVRVPGSGYGVLLLPKPRSYSAALREALAGIAPEGADAFVKALRDEWER